ncbi:ATP-binding protein [Streptomyces sp. NPDC046821]|uniref:ATP-binding protein n=1 Tax=Streptomyces sp. NPDC046821 TaxID=3154702 RepID=UPI00340CE6B9
MTPIRPHTTGHPGYSMGLACWPSSVPLARASALLTLRCWGLPKATADDVALIATELVTNAVRHATPATGDPEAPARCRLTVERPTPDTVRVTVSDSSPRRPVLAEAGEDDEAGRGLLLIQALSADWGTSDHTAGKSVWALVKVPAL